MALVATALVVLGSDTPRLFAQSASVDPSDEDRSISRVLFGSCIKQDLPMPILRTMLAEPANLVIFLGDNIYADTLDMRVMRAKYDLLGGNEDFVRLRSKYPILATWDDHDFGTNDSGSDYPMRKESQQEFMNFWQIAEDSPLHRREGVYDVMRFGPEGKRIQILLLDTRYFRSPLKLGPERRVGGPYVPDDDPTKTMLGEAQWKWLEEQLRQPAELRIIASSVQCIPDAAGQETWSNLPRERQRLFELIRQCHANGVVLVSGDRHWAELSKLEDDVPYPLYEMTSSSFNQIHARGTPTDNRYRARQATYHRENYGVLEVDWDPAEPTVTLQIRDLAGAVRIEQVIPLGELSAR